jgi:hypothetical protein
MHTLLTNIIELSNIEDFTASFSINQVVVAKRLIYHTPKTTNHFFQILCAMNLINAALKDKQFNQEIYYGILKPNVSKLLNFILDENKLKFNIKFYINQQES